MYLSIVIPAFEESSKIELDIEQAAAFISDNNFTGEIVIVDDGSKDDTALTAENTRSTLPENVKLKVLSSEKNRGKGYAIRSGMKETSGKFVMFADSGGCVPYEFALDGIKLIEDDQCDIDIAHASRKLDDSMIVVHQNLYRRICSRLFRWFLFTLMKLPPELTDTQCGFKIYRGDTARSLYQKCITDGFMFDVEIILRAIKEEFRIDEFPIEWSCDHDSRLSPTKNVMRIIVELIRIKKKIAGEILPVVKSLANEVEKAGYLSRLAKELDIDEKVLWKQLEKEEAIEGERVFASSVKETSKSSKLPIKEAYLFAMLFSVSPSRIKSTIRKIALEDIKDPKLLALLETLKGYLKDIKRFRLENFSGKLDGDLRRVFEELVLIPLPQADVEEEFAKALAAVKKGRFIRERKELLAQVRKAEKAEKSAQVKNLQRQIQELSRKIDGKD